MGGRNGSNGTSRSNALQKKVDELEDFRLRLGEANAALRVKIDDLIKVNTLQVSRLCGEELLRNRIKELEAQLKKDGA